VFLISLFDPSTSVSGGYGTLEELLEVITWAQLGIHDKPVSFLICPIKTSRVLYFKLLTLFPKNEQVGLLNVDGYYNYLLTFIDKAVDDGFIKPSQRNIIVSAPSAKELVQKLEVGGLHWCFAFFFIVLQHVEVAHKYGKDNLVFEERIYPSLLSWCSFSFSGVLFACEWWHCFLF